MNETPSDADQSTARSDYTRVIQFGSWTFAFLGVIVGVVLIVSLSDATTSSSDTKRCSWHRCSSAEQGTCWEWP